MQHIAELVFSLLTIALAILAIVTFIYHGASGAFYVTVIIAIAIGFINAWLVSKTGETVPARAVEPKPKKAVRRKKSAVGRR
jgi:uncharacterized membrane protein YciS (DUF1049 family)